MNNDSTHGLDCITTTHRHAPKYTPDLFRRLSPEAIDAAARVLEGVVETTPCEYSQRLSAQTGAQVFLKREDRQNVRSYKIRGAYTNIRSLISRTHRPEIVTASAGNHAQGVAFACHSLGLQGRIFVPETTSQQKCQRIQHFGGSNITIVPHGVTYDDAAAAAAAYVTATDSVFVHPFNDPQTIHGQGTIAREIFDQLQQPPTVLIVPVGGGGCLAGIATYALAKFPDITIVAAEPAGAGSLMAGLEAQAPVILDTIDPFVDGAAVKRIGDYALSVALEHAPVSSHHGQLEKGKIVPLLVDEGHICTSLLTMYQSDGIIAEPAGALAVAALDLVELSAEDRVVCLISGGNNDVTRYAEISERSLIHRQLKHYFLVNFHQKPGSLRTFVTNVLGADDDITLFEYVKKNNRETGPALIGLELGGIDRLEKITYNMDQSGLRWKYLSPDEAISTYLRP